jgi:hypothetical protein
MNILMCSRQGREIEVNLYTRMKSGQKTIQKDWSTRKQEIKSCWIGLAW